MKRHKISDIAAALGARFEGDGTLEITGASEPATAKPEALALAMDSKYAAGLASGNARAAILWDGADWQALGLKAAIFVPRPRYAMAGLTRFLDTGPAIAKGIHPTAVIDQSAAIGEGAAIGPFVVIGAGVTIGRDARIASHVSVADGSTIGHNAMILQGVRIGEKVAIGNDFIAQPGCIIGADGFSFVTPDRARVENLRETLETGNARQDQSWARIHSLGSVQIGDGVEVGANSTIDRGTIRNTVIGAGTKIDNLVMIAHNVEVGKDTLICSQVGIAGSTKIGNRVVLAGQVGVNDNIFVGDDVIAGGASKIFTNVPNGRVVLGHPAVKMKTHIEMQKSLRRLPRFMKREKE